MVGSGTKEFSGVITWWQGHQPHWTTEGGVIMELETEIQMAKDISNILKSVTETGMPTWKCLSNLDWASRSCKELKERIDREHRHLYNEPSALVK